MDVFILDTNYNLIKIFDNYESFIWTDRYTECGDFELRLPVSEDALAYLKADYYVQILESDRTMIIEDIQIESDEENTSVLVVTGRSLEVILERRVILEQYMKDDTIKYRGVTISGNLQNKAIAALLAYTIMYGGLTIDDTEIAPDLEEVAPDRGIEEFTFKRSTDDKITSIELESEKSFSGENLYDEIQSLCDEHDIGLRLTLSADKKLIFELYSGVDRSYEQSTNPYVIFSPSFDNLLNSNYLESHKDEKNVAIVGGKGEDDAREYATAYHTGAMAGVLRKELFVNAKDVEETGEEPLIEAGKKELKKSHDTTVFDGEVDPSSLYKYGTPEEISRGEAHYYIGDIVQLVNEYGMGGRSRISEMVYSCDSSGPKMYPTFTKIEETE